VANGIYIYIDIDMSTTKQMSLVTSPTFDNCDEHKLAVVSFSRQSPIDMWSMIRIIRLE